MPIRLAVNRANRHDLKQGKRTESMVALRPEATQEQPQGMCQDKGDDYDDQVRQTLKEFGLSAHIQSRGQEAKEIAQAVGNKARRWVVERAHSWMNRFRRILLRWDQKPENYLAFIHFGCAFIAFRSAALFG